MPSVGWHLQNLHFFKGIWRARRDSNPRPSASKGRRGDLYPAGLRALARLEQLLQFFAAAARLEMTFSTYGLSQRGELFVVHQFPRASILG
jgi:hypothetical protein